MAPLNKKRATTTTTTKRGMKKAAPVPPSQTLGPWLKRDPIPPPPVAAAAAGVAVTKPAITTRRYQPPPPPPTAQMQQVHKLFDFNCRLGPKVGITRRARLQRWRLLQQRGATDAATTVPGDIQLLIDTVPNVGDYLYTDRTNQW